jgi:hypothetical protein
MKSYKETLDKNEKKFNDELIKLLPSKTVA